MADRYGKHYTDLPISKRGQGSVFMKAFEDIRNDFNGKNYKSSSLQLIMRDLKEEDPRCVQYDTDDGEVILTSSVP